MEQEGSGVGVCEESNLEEARELRIAKRDEPALPEPATLQRRAPLRPSSSSFSLSSLELIDTKFHEP